ncbi:MAG: hypothetical protein VX733_04345 [Candidatus Latescibacterota bacterium]|nr:hypothetical protein [Candidatus Latescibacterota bacterium]
MLDQDKVVGHVGQVQVFPMTTATIPWTSEWQSGEGIAEFCDPIYQALLDDLKLR